MPIYDYKCNDCGNIFERIVANKDVIVDCPECNGKNTARLLSAFAVKHSSNQSMPCEAEGHHCCGNCSCHH